MDKFTTHTGVGVPLRRSNVDTDQIIPAVYLKRVTRTGFEDGLFAAWRNDPDVRAQQRRRTPRARCSSPAPTSAPARRASTRCGRCRTTASRVVISPRFADIFRGNSGKAGLLAAQVDEKVVQRLWDLLESTPGRDRHRRPRVAHRAAGEGDDAIEDSFDIDDYTRWRLLEGLDDIGITLSHEADIATYEADAPSLEARQTDGKTLDRVGEAVPAIESEPDSPKTGKHLRKVRRGDCGLTATMPSVPWRKSSTGSARGSLEGKASEQVSAHRRARRALRGEPQAGAHALESVLDTITREVAKGEKVAITGFGSFEKRVRNARWVRNPQTGERMKAKKTAVPKFTAGADLKNVVSGAKKLPKLTGRRDAQPAGVRAGDAANGRSGQEGRRAGEEGDGEEGHRAKKSAAKKAAAAKTTRPRSRRPRSRPQEDRQEGAGQEDRHQGTSEEGQEVDRQEDDGGKTGQEGAPPRRRRPRRRREEGTAKKTPPRRPPRSPERV